MSAAVLSAIKHAWPDARAKRIANGLGCSVITGKRIASTGNVSGRFRLALIRLLDDAIAENRTKMEQLQGQLKEIAYGEMLERVEARRPATLRTNVEEAKGSSFGTDEPQPVARGSR